MTATGRPVRVWASDPPSDLIQSVSRAAVIMEVVGRAPLGLTTAEIAEHCALVRATTGHLVRTLAFHGYLRWWESGRYTLGPAAVARVGDLARQLERKRRVGATVSELAAHLDVPAVVVERLIACAATDPMGEGNGR